MLREEMIKTYFHMWVSRDFTSLDTLFDPSIYYSECYGPEYNGINEIQHWIKDSLKRQIVHEWSIHRFIHQEDTVVVEWLFKDEVNHKQNQFNGVSIIEFKNQKIVSIKEFQSTYYHKRPYQNK